MVHSSELHEEAVKQLKEAHKICKTATLESLANLQKILNGSDEQNSEEETAVVTSVAQV